VLLTCSLQRCCCTPHLDRMFPVPEETSTLVTAIVLGHIALVGLLIFCLARQDTDPEWMKKQKEAEGKAQ
jgi:hypothetical protein